MPLFIVRNDIVNMTTDAIVLPANQILEEGSGASRAIFEAAGEEKLTVACREIGECELGEAVITDGFDLHARYIIHAVCPKWYGGNMNEEKILRNAYFNSLKLASEYKLKTIAFPLLSTGNYGYPKRDGLEVARKAIDTFLHSHEMDVYLVLYDGDSLVESQSLFKDIESFIDDNYVGAKDESFIIEQGSRRDKWKKAHPFPDIDVETEIKKPIEVPVSNDVRYSISTNYEEEIEKNTEQALNIFTIEDIIRSNKQEVTFSDYLMKLIDRRGMTNAQVYKKANVSKSVFHTIWSNKHQIPKKNTVLAFAIALELDLKETNELLKKAGYAFSNAIVFDVLIQYFITHKIYDVFKINEILYDYNQPLLGMKTN